MSPSVKGLLIILGLASVATTLALSAVAALFRRRRDEDAGDPLAAVFLFDGDRLLDASPPARALLPASEAGGETPAALVPMLEDRFPDLGPRMAAQAPEAPPREVLTGPAGDRAVLTRWDGYLRVDLRLMEAAAGDPAPLLDRLTRDSLEQELAALREILRHVPVLVWKENKEGTVTWANRAYLARADSRAPEEGPSWPPPRLFPTVTDPPADPPEDGDLRRERFPLKEAEATTWFDVESRSEGSEWLRFAFEATAEVRAEEDRAALLQTLTKTFAQLSAGLAIFDRDRRLSLFNPALVELTGLPAGFLSGRPTMRAVLDRLRDARMLPEPRNYRSWREELTALMTEAARGTYAEVWTLPGGRTYRVTGRPHPEGAIALVFEDITEEVALTRRFRDQIDTAYAVLDALPEALVIFDGAGRMLASNLSYRNLWHRAAAGPGAANGGGERINGTHRPETGEAGHLALGQARLAEELAVWTTRCAPSPLWERLTENPAPEVLRQPGDTRVQLRDGPTMVCRVRPLSGGAVLVIFSGAAGRLDPPRLPPPEEAGPGPGSGSGDA